MKICSDIECERKHHSHGYCKLHWRRIQNASKEPSLMSKIEPYLLAEDWLGLTFAVRQLSEISHHTGCWNWPQLNSIGYGRIHANKKAYAMHRLMMQAKLNGDDLGKEPVHHKCANRACCNPDHLELISTAENMAEMLERKFYKTRIKELEEENLELRKRIFMYEDGLFATN